MGGSNFWGFLGAAVLGGPDGLMAHAHNRSHGQGFDATLGDLFLAPWAGSATNSSLLRNGDYFAPYRAPFWVPARAEAPYGITIRAQLSRVGHCWCDAPHRMDRIMPRHPSFYSYWGV